MRKNYFILTVVFCLFTFSPIFGQTDVPPGVPDALFNAVSAANAGDVLVLTGGAVYPNSATIPVSVPLTIKTADDATAKAVLVRIPDASGTYAANLFQVDASLTLKNIIANGQRGTAVAYSSRFLNCGNVPDGVIHLDGVEVSRFQFLRTGNDLDSLIVENCLFNGNLSGAGGWGGTFDFQGDQLHYARIQNNTFMFTTFGPLLAGGWGNYMPANQQKQTVIIDHNTVYCVTGAHGPTTMISRTEDMWITNNLYINATLRPNEFFSDKKIDFPQNEKDITPFRNVITELGPEGLWVISLEMVDTAGTQLDMQSNNIYYTPDVLEAWSSRGLDPCWVYTNNTKIAIIDETNAYFEESVAFTNAPDAPMFAVNAIADNAAAGNTALAAGDSSFVGTTPFSGWDWWDPATFAANFDLRERDNLDMSYNTDAVSYSAGIDGFPLGDLNWFPAMKDLWASGGAVSVEKTQGLPTNYSLAQNYPNPFNPSTKISFSIPESGLVTLKVYNTLGQVVSELINEEMNPGNYSFDFNASELSSGIYVYQITAGTFTSSKKMMFLK